MTLDPAASDPEATARPDEPWFPYMAWAQHQSSRTARALSQSGMPPADPSFLASLSRAGDLDFPGREALPALEAGLAERFRVPRSRVLVTLGATGGMFLCAARAFRAGSRVVTEIPSYDPFRALPRFFGADLRVVERRFEERWALDPERVRAALARGVGPGHVFLSNPHNPTGVMHDRGQLRLLAREAERAGGWLVSCDIYMEYVPESERVFAHEVAPNAISIGSLTKAYGLGALRVGWIVLGEALESERARLLDLAYLGWVDPPTATLRAARAALQDLAALGAPLRRVERESRPLFLRFLSSTAGLECVVPPHGIIAFPRVLGVGDTRALGEFLVRNHGVDVVPGEFFGLAGHVRVGCGVPAEVLADGLARLARGVADFRIKSG